jgi:ubiquinone/menaquinone biosynthesis C-methylase UbiE
MGVQNFNSFDEAAKNYAHRISYVPPFFAEASKQLALDKDTRLLDIACGSGELSSGFSQFCGDITAIDQSEKMLELARSKVPASASLVRFDLNQPFSLDIGRFDVIAIGRALRYLTKEPLFDLLEQTLKETGSILICGSGLDSSTPWAETYVRVVRPFQDMSKPIEPSWREIFVNAPYEARDVYKATGKMRFSVDDLLNNTLSYRTFAAPVSANLGEVKTQLTEALRPYFSDENALLGTVVSHGRRYQKKVAV